MNGRSEQPLQDGAIHGRSERASSLWRGFGRRTLGPLAILAGSLVLSLGIYFGLVGSTWMRVVSEWTARSTSAVLNLLGSSTSAYGTVVSSGDFAIDIVAECTVVGPLVLFAGAVVAYPSTLKAKGSGILMGTALLTAANLIRLTSLFWIGSTFPRYLDVAHLLVWQTAIILLAIVLWLLWAQKVADARKG